MRNNFIMPREKLRDIWENADWRSVIDLFGLEMDKDHCTRNDELWIKSPFSDEKNASMHINLRENIFKDFSSGKGSKGGILTFCQDLLRMRGYEMNCYEVAQWMVDKGISKINPGDTKRYQINKQKILRDEKEKKVFTKRPDANKPIGVSLRPWLEMDHPELLRRGILRATCEYLVCGFLPKRQGGNSPLNGRIVFQIRGVRKEGSVLKPVILSHVGRALTKDQERDGKYWGFPFRKGLELYNQDNILLDPSVKGQIEQYGLILTEGFFDAAALAASGCFNVCALMGAHITEEQIEKLRFINSHINIPKIILFLDRDKTGAEGTKKALSMLRDNGFIVEAFDWERISSSPCETYVKIFHEIKDPGDIPIKQLRELRRRGVI